jgi:hypothetical protein
MRIYSLLFTTLLGMFLAGVGLLSLATGSENVKLDVLPYWKGNALLYWLSGLGLAGLAAVSLAVLDKTKVLLALYSFAALCLIVYGYFISPVHSFAGPAEAKWAAWITLGALAAFIGAVLYCRKPSRG